MIPFRDSRHVAGVRDFLLWWKDELAACVPETVRSLSSRIGRTDIRLLPDGVLIDRTDGETGRTFAEERPLEYLDQEAWRQLGELMAGARVRLFLPPGDIWCTRLRLPLAARTGLGKAIALQLPLVSPLQVEQVDWNWCVEQVEGSQVHVLLAMVRRQRIDDIVDLFEQNGILPPPIFCMIGAGALYLRKGTIHHYAPATRRERRLTLLAAALVASIPVTTLSGVELLKFTNEAQLTQLRTEIRPKLAAQRRARRHADLSRALAPLADAKPASGALIEIASLVPEDAYIQQFSHDLSGESRFTLAGEIDGSKREAVAKGTSRLEVSPTSPATADGAAAAKVDFRAVMR